MSNETNDSWVNAHYGHDAHPVTDNKPAAAQEAVMRGPLSPVELRDLLPAMQKGWTIETYATWAIRAAERAHGITSSSARVAAPQPIAEAQSLAEKWWGEVCDALSEADPDWMLDGPGGIESAVVMIRKLAARPAAPPPSTAAAPGIDLEQFREAVQGWRDSTSNDQADGRISLNEWFVIAGRADRLLALIDASPKGQ